MMTIELEPKDSIREAIANAPEGPLTLILSGGTWREKIVVNRPDVTMISEEGAVIEADDRSGYYVGDSATFTIAAPSFSAMGITFLNSFDYEGAVRWNTQHKEESPLPTEAVALRTTFGAITSSFRACSFVGHQATLLLDSGTTFLEDCTVRGTGDFIFGSGSALFQGCEIISEGEGPVVYPSTYQNEELGFVFHDSDFRATPDLKKNSVYLCHPWFPYGTTNRKPMALFIDCSLSGHIHPSLWCGSKELDIEGVERTFRAEDGRFYIYSDASENVSGEYAMDLLHAIMRRY